MNAARYTALALLFFASPAAAQELRIAHPVTDTVGVLDPSALEAIETRIVDHRHAHLAQIAVVIVRDTGGVPISDWTIALAERWEGGSAARDDGVIFAIALDTRDMRLEVGYGLEDRIPDSVAVTILDGIVPLMRERRFDAAVWQVVDEVIVRTGGEHREPPPVVATHVAPDVTAGAAPTVPTPDPFDVPSAPPSYGPTAPAPYAGPSSTGGLDMMLGPLFCMMAFCALIGFFILFSGLVGGATYGWRRYRKPWGYGGGYGPAWKPDPYKPEPYKPAGGGWGWGGGKPSGGSSWKPSGGSSWKPSGGGGFKHSNKSWGGGGGKFGGGGASKKW